MSKYLNLNCQYKIMINKYKNKHLILINKKNKIIQTQMNYKINQKLVYKIKKIKKIRFNRLISNYLIKKNKL